VPTIQPCIRIKMVGTPSSRAFARPVALPTLRAASAEQAFGSTVFSSGSYERGWNMRKLSLALAAVATIAVAAPTIASAEDFGVGVRIGGDRDRVGFRDRGDFRGARAEFREHDRGLHRGWYRDRGERTVIIKRRHRDWD
jgi:hypothetical protein